MHPCFRNNTSIACDNANDEIAVLIKLQRLPQKMKKKINFIYYLYDKTFLVKEIYVYYNMNT